MNPNKYIQKLHFSVKQKKYKVFVTLVYSGKFLKNTHTKFYLLKKYTNFLGFPKNTQTNFDCP